MESVPRWNDLEHILLPLKRVLGRSEMQRSRIYSPGFETLSLYFGTFSLLSNKLHLWTHSRSSADKSLIHPKNHFQSNSTSSIEWCTPIHCNSNRYHNNNFLKSNLISPEDKQLKIPPFPISVLTSSDSELSS